MPSVSSDSSLGFSAMLPAHWLPESHPMIPPFRDDEVKHGIQAPHVAPSPEKEHFRHKSMAVNELKPCHTPKKTGGVTVYGYRHYSPKTGQFLGRDPIDESGGVNLYGFVENDGVNQWDILGQAKFTTFDADPATFPVSRHEGAFLGGEQGKTEKIWPGKIDGESYAMYGDRICITDDCSQKVTLAGGTLTQTAVYASIAADVEYVIKHERRHVEINKTYFNMFVNEINWLETRWCEPCGELAVEYVNATSDYRKQQAQLEHAEYHVQEFIRYPDPNQQKEHVRTAQSIRETVAKFKVAYENAYNKFWPICKGKNRS